MTILYSDSKSLVHKIRPDSKIRPSKFLSDVNTFALGINEVFERHPYFDVVPHAEYDLQKDILNAV
jgi:hypothetical protein